MKKLVFLCVLGLAFAAAAPALAQFEFGGGDFAVSKSQDMQSATTREQIALIYHRLAGRLPNWKEMASKTDEYLKASEFEKESVLEAKVTSLRNNFQLVSFDDKVIVKMPVTLSTYSMRNKGFIINELGENLNFKYNYGGRDYALIPLGIADQQWIDASDDKVAATIEAARPKTNAYTLIISVAANYADPPERTTELEDGKLYNILTGPVVHVTLYDEAGKTYLWDNKRKEVTDPVGENLLKLKQ
jgi:hypothetical protein